MSWPLCSFVCDVFLWFCQSRARCGNWLYRFLIFAFFFTFIWKSLSIVEENTRIKNLNDNYQKWIKSDQWLTGYRFMAAIPNDHLCQIVMSSFIYHPRIICASLFRYRPGVFWQEDFLSFPYLYIGKIGPVSCWPCFSINSIFQYFKLIWTILVDKTLCTQLIQNSLSSFEKKFRLRSMGSKLSFYFFKFLTLNTGSLNSEHYAS